MKHVRLAEGCGPANGATEHETFAAIPPFVNVEDDSGREQGATVEDGGLSAEKRQQDKASNHLEVTGAWGHGAEDLEVFDHIGDEQDTAVPFGYGGWKQLVASTIASDVAEVGVEHANRLTNLYLGPSGSVGATEALSRATNLEPVMMHDGCFVTTIDQCRQPS